MKTMLNFIEPGALTTVQDRGRLGWARFGIPESGPMDRVAFAAANRLVGNPPEAAGLEVTLVGPLVRTLRDALISICGADFEVWVDSIPVPCWHGVFARAGSLIRFGGRRAGARAYLAIAGGIDVPPVLGSRSTYLPGALGGFGGRALCGGDRLAVGADPLWRRPHQVWADAGACWPKSRRPVVASDPTVRIVLGPQDDAFTAEALIRLLGAVYTVSPNSDRMGIRLDGPPIQHVGATGIVSDGVICGSIQVPPDGRPIVMMVDHQTTGGYPKIATVIEADLPLLAQCLPGDGVRFEPISVAAARAASQGYLQEL